MISSLSGQYDCRLLAHLSPKEIADKRQRTMAVDIGEEFQNLEAIEYWECQTTKFRWYSPAAATCGGELYAQLEKYDWYYIADKWEFSAPLDFFGRVVSAPEIGVGKGVFCMRRKDGAMQFKESSSVRMVLCAHDHSASEFMNPRLTS